MHAINTLTSDISKNLLADEFTAAVLIDLEKAFDTVWLEGLFFKLINKGFPRHLIKILWPMLNDKKFRMTDGRNTSEIVFTIKNGLQQGTVNAPILFNIYTHSLLEMYHINETPDLKGIAFADDVIIYCKGNLVTKCQEKLQNIFELTKQFYDTWRLRINFEKCETILYRPNMRKVPKANQHIWKDFHLVNPINNNQIEHKPVVRYLGVHLDEKLYYTKHINIQIKKAKAQYYSLSSLFHSRRLLPRVKLICYMLLIRPILTYGCQSWYNISPSIMERLRAFERSCLRACLGKYRTPQSGYQKFYSNKLIYKWANIPRIDNFILKLCRNHVNSSKRVEENPLISQFYVTNDREMADHARRGFVPPEAFTYLDKRGYLQTDDNIPIIYHKLRHAKNKTFGYEPIVNVIGHINELRHCMDLPPCDIKFNYKNKEKYEWLN